MQCKFTGAIELPMAQQSPAQIWETLHVGYTAARSRTPDEVQFRLFRIAGFAIAMEFVGLSLARMFQRSLAHLEVEAFEADEPVLRIELWDAAATHTQPPALNVEAFADRGPFADGQLARSDGGRYCAYGNDRTATLLDAEQGRMVGYVHSAESLLPYEVGKPLQPLLFAWYGRHDMQPTHAACVALGDDGVLIGGAGGSGKSTTSLACTMAGLRYLADDYTALPAFNQVQRAYSLYASLWLEEEHSRQFAFLRQHRMDGVPCPELKQPFALADAHPEQMAVACTVRAIVLPRIAHIATTTLTPATSLEAMVKMAPSSVLQLPFIDPAAALRRLAQLVGHVPAFWLDLGTDIGSIPGCVQEALLRAKRLSEGNA